MARVDNIVDTTVETAENIKGSTADVLQEAAKKLREANLAGRGEDVKAVVSDLEDKAMRLRSDVEKKIEPMEDFISTHPFMSVMIAVGVGYIVGTMITRRS